MVERGLILGAVLSMLMVPLHLSAADAGVRGNAPLIPIDAGPGVPVSTYYGHLMPGENQPLAEIELPIVSRLVPGRLKASRQPVLEAKWLTQPVFLIGTDPASLDWLQHHGAALRRLGATGIVMAAPDPAALQRALKLAGEQALTLSPGPDHWLEDKLIAKGAGVLPLLIDLEGRATQEPGQP